VKPRITSLHVAGVVAFWCAAPMITGATLPADGARFRPDDPLAREPETQDASGVRAWSIDLIVDIATNLFGSPGDPASGVRAGNVNTVDDVPDSSWFTNRILGRPLSIEEAARGPLTGRTPAAGDWTVVASKSAGVAPGFTIEDGQGDTWFISLDARGYPEAATGAILVANRIFWSLGYWQPENVLTHVRPERLVIGDTATVTPPSGVTRRMRASDLDAVWRRAHPSPDGSFRAVASRRLPGRPLGGFRYHGTRPDDPNDLVPHEHRRELRALKVFGAWTNLVDMKAGNTLDVLVPEGGRAVVRHYLQDVGSTFGTGAVGPREFDEGWEYLHENALMWRRLVLFGFPLRPWQTVSYDEYPSIGRFEGTVFDPIAWKPRVPVAALRHAQPDDLFWAARRVMAFSDGMIRALVRTGMFSDAAAERHLADVLIQRRDKIGRSYLIAVSPLVDFALSSDGGLTMTNAAVAAGFVDGHGGGYRGSWTHFDNATGLHRPIGAETAARGPALQAPGPLPPRRGTFVSVVVSHVSPAFETWLPVRAYFRGDGQGWTLVGLDRSGA
jgi:hypothetical protein